MAGPPNTPPNLADQVARLTEEVDTDRAHRRQASAERAQQTAVVDTWLSKERVVLVAFIIALPVLGVLVWTNITGQTLIDLVTPDPPPEVAQQRAQEALDSVVEQIGAYRQDYSELPDSLAEVGIPPGDWTYAKGSNGNYRVRLSIHGRVVTYDSLQSHAAAAGRRP